MALKITRNGTGNLTNDMMHSDLCCNLCDNYSLQFLFSKDDGIYYLCSVCGFVYGVPSVESGNKHKNTSPEPKMVEQYAGKMYSVKKQRYYRRKIHSFSKYYRTGQLLEIGANTGGFLFAAQKLGWNVSGVEPAAEFACYGRENYDLNIITSTFEDANLPENYFDVVYSNAVLEHLQFPSDVFQKAFRVLRPGGLFYGLTVNFDSYTYKFLGENWHLLSPNGHYSIYTPQTLRAFCEKAGMTNITIKSNGVRLSKTSLLFTMPILRNILKGWYSTLTRFTLKGDRVIVLARKP